MEEEWESAGAKKSKKKGGSNPAEDVEPSGPVTLNNKAKKLKKRLTTFYEKYNKAKVRPPEISSIAASGN